MRIWDGGDLRKVGNHITPSPSTDIGSGGSLVLYCQISSPPKGKI